MIKRNLIVFDGHNLLFKAYGVPFKFYSKKGTPLHVVTAFISLLRRGVKTIAPQECTDIAVVFDSQAATSNHVLLDSYKANRKDYSEDVDSPFHHQPYVEKALQKLKIKIYRHKGVEADDLIASLTKQYLAKYRNAHVYIVSNDSDFYQLISKKVSQIILGKKGSHVFLTPEEIKQRLNVLPKEYVYFKSLTGDTSDNIIGVPGIGKVRAARIINQKLLFDTKPHTETLSRNRKLITLTTTITVCKNWDHLLLHPRVETMNNKELFIVLDF